MPLFSPASFKPRAGGYGSDPYNPVTKRTPKSPLVDAFYRAGQEGPPLPMRAHQQVLRVNPQGQQVDWQGNAEPAGQIIPMATYAERLASGETAPMPGGALDRYRQNHTTGGRYGAAVPNVPGQGTYDADVHRAQGIARQGNLREAMLGQMNRRPTGYQPPPPAPEFGPPGNPAGAEAMFAGMGYYKNPRTGTWSPNQQIMDMGPAAIRREQVGGNMVPFTNSHGAPVSTTPAMAAAVAMLNSPQRQAYLEARDDEMAYRRENVQRNAMERSAARRGRMGIGNPVDQFFRQNPLAGLQYGMQQQQMGLRQQALDQEGALGWGRLGVQNEANQARLRSGDNEMMAAFVGALPQLIEGGLMTPEQGQQMMQAFGSQMFGSGMQQPTVPVQQGVAPRMTAKDMEQFRRDAMTNPDKARRDAIAKGASPAQAAQAISEINPNAGGSWFTDFANSPMGDYWGGGVGDYIGGQLDPYGAMARLIGIRPPPLSRPRRPTR